MKSSRYAEIAKRLAALPEAQQTLFRQKLAEQGIDSWQLPIVPAKAAVTKPLSFAQQRFVMAESLSEQALYNLCSMLELSAMPDVALLTQAFQQLVARHEILRTCYQQQDNGDWYASLIEDAWSAMEQEAVSNVTPEVLQSCYEEELSRSFDLANEHPFRVRLLQSEQGAWLFFTVHHVAFDAWSTQILVGELTHIYAALQNGQTVQLAAPAIQYSDYAVWQRSWHDSDDCTRQQTYWQQQLAQLPSHLSLTTDYARPTLRQRHYSGALTSLTLPADVVRDLRAQISNEGSTLFIYLQTVYAWMLARNAGQTDLCMGSSVANRGRNELNDMVGPLLNTLVMRHRLDANPTFAQALQNAQTMMAQAYDHQDVPFEALPELLQWQRDPSYSPIFQVMFVHVALPATQSIRFGQAHAKVLTPQQHQARFDLTLRVVELAGEEIRLDLEYSTELFAQATAECFLAQMASLIDRTTSSLDATKNITVNDWRFPYDHSLSTGPALQSVPTHLPEQIAHWANERPHAAALRTATETLTYDELGRQVQNLSAWLAAQGVVEGDRVALCLPRSIEQVTLMLACWHLGAIAVMLDPKQPAARLQQVIASAQARLTLVTPHAHSSEFEVPEFEATTLVMPDLSSLSEGSAAKVSLTPDQAAYLLFTSGSTGTPKGVLVSHGAMAHYAQALWDVLPATTVQTWATLATTAADLGMTSVLSALYRGQTLVLPDAELAFDPPGLAEFMAQEPVDCLKIVPSHLRGLLSVSEPHSVLPRQQLILGGEGMDEALLAQLRELAPELTIVNHYGPSEACVGVACHVLDSEQSDAASSRLPLGKALPGMTLEVRDEQGQRVPVGCQGELYISGPQLALSYWQQPEQTAQAFPQDAHGRWYRTGDRVRLTATGLLEFLGRCDDQIKHRGYRLEPGEVEHWLMQQNELSQARLRQQYQGERALLVAYVVLHSANDGLEPSAPSLAALQTRMAHELPSYMVPDLWQVMDNLPLNANGKVDAKQLPWPLLDEQDGVQRQEEASLTANEQRLALLWQQVLKIDRATAQDNFYDLGGDSILSLQLIGLAAQQALRITPAEIAQHPTLAEMAKCLPEPSEVELPETTQALIHLYNEVLQRTDLNAESDFYQVGGDSILSLQLIAKARAQGIQLTPKLLTQAATPKALNQALHPVLESETKAESEAKSESEARAQEKQQNVSDSSNHAPQAYHSIPVRLHPDQAVPVSAAQQRLWFLQQLEPDSTSYHVSQCFELQGVLDREALSKAVEQLKQRHGILRCRFYEQDGQVWQQLYQTERSNMSYHDVAAQTEANLSLSAKNIVRHALQQVFDLAHGETFAVTLIRLAPERHYLLVNLHHIVTDGWSMGLLVQDFLAFYQESGASNETLVVTSRPDYLDWVAYQQLQHHSSHQTKCDDYWRNKLEGMPPAIALSTDHPYHAQGAPVGKVLDYQFTSAVLTHIEHSARTLGVTPFQLMLAAFRLLLWRHSGQTDFAVGLPVAGRQHPESQSMVGLFVNTLVSRHPVQPEAPFATWLESMVDSLQKDLEHQEMPLEQLIANLQPERNLARSPLFQVLFNYQSDLHGSRTLNTADLEWQTLDLGDVERAAKFEISINLFRQPEGLSLQLEYNASVFDQVRAEQWLTDYVALIEAVCGDAKQSIEQYRLPSMVAPLIPHSEAITAQEDFLTRFEQQVQQTPDATALIVADQKMSYQALNDAANRTAHWLLASGLVEQGAADEQCIAFCLPRTQAMVIALLAIQKAGAAYLPLDPSHPLERSRYVLDHAQPKCVWVADEAMQTALASDLVPTMTWHNVQSLSAVQHCDNPMVVRHPASLQYCLYTSGSTGKPKGVAVERRQFANFLTAMERQLPAFQSLLALTTVTFDIAGLELCLPLVKGATVVLGNEDDRRDSERLSALVKQHGVDLIQATPSGWRLLAELAPASLANITALVGGEALEVELARQLQSRCKQVINVYGPTETTVWSTYQTLRGNLSHALVAIGEPLRNNQCFVLDERLQPVPKGVIGELYIGGDAVTRGYLKQPALTAERYIPNPFMADGSRLYRTGDRVKQLAEGGLYFVERADHQVKIRGFRVELGEIESLLMSHPSVQHAAVGVWRQHHGDVLHGYCVMRAGHVFDSADLRTYLSAQLPEYMVPSSLQELAALPLNASGKVDRKALPEPKQSDVAEVSELTTVQERVLADAWQEVLGVTQLGKDSHFFHLGGHSLSAAQVRARLRSKGWSLPLKAVFDGPQLAAMAEQMVNDEQRTITPVARQTWMPLSPAQRRIWFMQQMDPQDAGFNMNFAVQIDGDLSHNALQHALDAVVARHEILRVTYHDHQGTPMQRVNAELNVPVQYYDLRGAEAAHVTEQQAVAAGQAFDLTKEAPLKVYLYQIAEHSFVCQMVQHHIASDGWSGERLIQDLAHAYRMAINTDASAQVQLPELTVQYLDYAVYQQSEGERQRQERGIGYWQTHLQGAPSQLALPFDYQRGSEQGQAGGDAYSFTLEAGVAQALQQVAKQHDCSVFMVLMALYTCVIHSESREQDLVIGTDSANRTLPETEPLIGFFVNLLALRFKPRVTMSFSDYLAHVKQVCLVGFEHQEVPFDQVVEAVKPDRIAGQHPLIQALLVLQNQPSAPDELLSNSALGNIRLTPIPAAQTHSKFDMALFVSEAEQGALALRWVYSKRLFEQATIERMAQALQQLAQWLTTASPERQETSLTALTTFIKGTTSMSDTLMSDSDTKKTPSKMGKLGKLKKNRQRESNAASGPRINVRPLSSERPFPLLVESMEPGLDANIWAQNNQAQILTWLEHHGGIVFRGFNLPDPVVFESFCQSMYPELYGQYGDLPKKEGGKKIYRSTPYPDDQMIMYHNESSHQFSWPRRQWFYCEIPSVEGGATPIVDCREMYHRLPQWAREKLLNKGLKYVRHFSGLDVSWQHFFKTEDKAEVEAICRKGDIQFEWYDEDKLCISQNCPAIIRHPVTGEMSFFNQIQLHHYSFLEEEVKAYLLNAGGEDKLPRNVYYGDGEPLEQDLVDLISTLYEACAVRFDWQKGDVVMLDNMLAAHARDPFKGERKIAVAMGDIYRQSDLLEAVQKEVI
ncbi:non-ribosomal peptide synthetase [Marinomonas sp. FW-1]|uniref:non-ribosomal peptide synthetase n=1 Tax=Marinomonas sp. FW-1 TaxID=2071621 RepID=UPI0010C0CF02|nr:non-ribosomal peptide synthetase [Marinomonas sp. FW-1]